MFETETTGAPASEATALAPVTETAPVAATTTEAPRPSMEDSLSATWDRINSAASNRDNRGRFAPKGEPAPAPDPATTEAAPLEPAGEVAPSPPDATAPDPALQPIEAPRDFTADQKAEFAKLPREAQAIVANAEKARLAEYTRRAQEHSEYRKQVDEYRKSADPFFQALQPFQSYLGQVAQSLGTPVPQLLAGLVQTEAKLRTGSPDVKRAALAEIATTYGIQLDAQGQDNALMGVITSLKQELGQVKGYLTQQQQAEHVRRQEAEQAQAGEMQRSIAAFAKDKPHFHEVRAVMAGLLQTEAAKDLNEAYEMACHASPAIRSKIEADKAKAAEDKRLKEAREHAAQAAKAAAPNVRSAPATPPRKKSMDDTLNAAWDRVQAT